MKAIRILIVDDHPMIRRGISSLLSSHTDLEVVGMAGDGINALKLAETTSPDIILLDIMMPGSDGLDVAQQLHKRYPQSKIIILTAYENQEYVIRALRAGAYAYLLKGSADETLVDSVRAVHRGQRLLSPELISEVLEQFQVMAETNVRIESGLSEEELQVLELIAKGETNEEIAQHMFWSERTVKRKVEEITSKLESRNRAQAVAEAMKRGLI
jgi:NarL family two-component system response regulator LiaR